MKWGRLGDILCGQALFTAFGQAKLSLTSDLESDKDRLCCLCGRSERSQPLSDWLPLRMHAVVCRSEAGCEVICEREGTLIPTRCEGGVSAALRP